MPRCPVCRTQTHLTKYEGVPIHNCGSCGGYWVTDFKLERILGSREMVMPEPVKQRMMDLAEQHDSMGRLLCMNCGVEMKKERFKHWDDIQLDRCPRCDGVWLDCGELEKCQIYWEYAQDHPEEWENRDMIDRKQRLETELERRRREREVTPFEDPHLAHGPGVLDSLRGLFGL